MTRLDHSFHTCPNCGMSYAAFKTCWGCMMGNVCETPERCQTPSQHTCPEPFPYDFAVSVAQSGPMIASQKFKARVVLGLKQGQK